MKHIKTYETINRQERKVYWVSTFGNKFEDSLVKLVRQYKGQKDEYDAIENIDFALGIANHARKIIPYSPDFVLIGMDFTIEDEEVVDGPNFEIYEVSDKKYVERVGYIFVGFAENTDREAYELLQDTKKYNL